MRGINNLNFKREYRKILIYVTIFFTVVLLGYGYVLYSDLLPDNIRIICNEEDSFSSLIPVTANFHKNCVGVISVDNKVINKKRLNVDLKGNSHIKANRVGKYKADLKAFGMLSLKKINVEVIENKKLIVGGIPVGIYVETDGLLVLGTDNIRAYDNKEYNPSQNILKSGDYILEVNGIAVSNKQSFIEYIQDVNSEVLDLKVRRNNQVIHVAVKRIKCKDGSYRIGTWIRNNMQGVGTVTYYDEEAKKYAALGHGINDIDTNTLMEIKEGAIYNSSIVDVVKGQINKPGELVGLINYDKENYMGTLNRNSKNGIYGEVQKETSELFLKKITSDKLKDDYYIGLSNKVEEGAAKLRCTVDNKIEEYDIKIIKTYKNNKQTNKNFVLRITDKRLLTKTSGIVQGMSGSPIIQKNKIIGALTHVFVNDPTKGYGIYIENMLG